MSRFSKAMANEELQPIAPTTGKYDSVGGGETPYNTFKGPGDTTVDPISSFGTDPKMDSGKQMAVVDPTQPTEPTKQLAVVDPTQPTTKPSIQTNMACAQQQPPVEVDPNDQNVATSGQQQPPAEVDPTDPNAGDTQPVPTTNTSTPAANPPADTTENQTTAAHDQDDPLATSAGYNSEQVTMEDAETVEARIASIIADDSPLMQQAKTAAAQAQNAKGTLNSSMAIGAGQAAVLDKATEIAKYDADTAASFKLANQASQDTSGQFNADQWNKNAQVLFQGKLERDMQAEQIALEKFIQGEKGDLEKYLQDRDITLQEYLQAENADLDMYLQSEQGQIDLAKIAANIEGDSRLINEKGEIDLGLQEAAADRQEELQALKGEIDKQLIEADGAEKAKLMDQQAEIDKELQEINNAHEQELQAQKA